MHFRRSYLAIAIISVFIAYTGGSAMAKSLADFTAARNWNVSANGNVTMTPGPNDTYKAVFQADKNQDKSLVMMLKNPAVIPDDAIRVGLWVYIEQPVVFKSQHVLIEDGTGRKYEYTLKSLEKKQIGWQYIDTFPFDANELGRLHPQVGRLTGEGTGLPKRPMKLLGIRFESDAASQGEIYFHSFESDAYTLDSGKWHWGLVVPGDHFRLNTCLIQSNVRPYMLAGQLLPNGGDAFIDWQIQSGFQGKIIRNGSEHLAFAKNDLVAKARRIDLGDLPAGNYNVLVGSRISNPENGTPDQWRRLVWQATGDTLWQDTDAADVARYVTGRKTGGNGYAGWRQTIAVNVTGPCEFKVSAKGTGTSEARVVPLDRERRSIDRPFAIRFSPSEQWVSRSQSMTLPEGTAYLYIDLVAMSDGTASFDAVSLHTKNQDLILNGSFEQGNIYQQRIFPLTVMSSASGGKYIDPQAWSVDAGQSLRIPAPLWHDQPGEKQWKITDKTGHVIASGTINSQPVEWTPQSSGTYQYVAIRKVNSLVMDRQEYQLGCRTPLKAIGDSDFHARSKVATEKDIFDSGNYFTWSMYEYHPEEKNFYPETQQWIKDGRAAGFSLFRLRIEWSKAEPLPGVYDFAMTDRLIADVAREGGRVVIEPMLASPEWLRFNLQLNNYGRGDIWQRGYVQRQASIWSPGMLEAIRRFNEAIVLRYRNNTSVVGYHLWGLPDSVDWTSVDQPWLGQHMDYSPASITAFNQWSKNKYASPPIASQDWSQPDLSQAWRDWIAFRRYGLEHFFIDSVLKPIRKLDDRRPIVGYFGLDFASEALAESSRTLNWRRHTGGCELYYQVPLQAMRAVYETGREWPQEVHYLTPLAPALEQATYQIGVTGGHGYNWNYYWRNNFAVGTWTADREAGLVEWKKFWRDLWKELHETTLSQRPDIAGVSTWSTMQYGVRTFFPLRLGDYSTRVAAAMYRDQLWPTWFSENATFERLNELKLIVVPHGAAQVMPAKLADALAVYVQNGGNIVLFPDSGKWVIEEGERPDALLRRLGWKHQLTSEHSSLQAVDLGNSGLPPMPGSEQLQNAVVSEPSSILNPQSLKLQNSVIIPDGGYTVLARFENGQRPAAITWRHGRGNVVMFAGNPDWINAKGLLASLYQWAGGKRDAGTNLPYVQVNHLVRNDTHYLILHRMPDSLSPRYPMPYAIIDRQKLQQMAPEVTAMLHVKNLPAGQWRVEDVTAEITPSGEGYPGVHSSQEFAKGIPVRMFLAQTRVLKIQKARPE